MIDRSEVWQQRSWIWWVPLLFVALNIGAIVFFQTAFAGQLDVLETRYDEQAEQLKSYSEEREHIAAVSVKAKTLARVGSARPRIALRETSVGNSKDPISVRRALGWHEHYTLSPWNHGCC